MRGDLQCHAIFFQPKGWKTAVRLHRSHNTIFNRFMEDQYYYIHSAAHLQAFRRCCRPPFFAVSRRISKKSSSGPDSGSGVAVP
jgi:hypothetical protein